MNISTHLLALAWILVLIQILTLGQLIITEVQPVPNGEPEWVEIVNTTNRAVKIENWLICDLRSCVRLPDASIPAHGTLVVTRDADGLREARNIPSNVLVLEVALPSLNNSTETIELLDKDSTSINLLTYNLRTYTRGRSIERIGVCAEGNEQGSGSGELSDAGAECIVWSDVWAANVSADSSTCGRFNSVVSMPHDLRVAAIRILDASVAVDIVNHGSEPMKSVNTEINVLEIERREIENSEPGTKIPELRTWNVEHGTPTLLAGEVFTWEIPLSLIGGYTDAHAVRLTANIRVVDARNSNDKLSIDVTYPPPPGNITITEIMFDPWSPMKDYVEVYNGTADTIDLQGWMVEDISGVRGTVATPCIVAPREYCVLSASEDVRSMMHGGTLALFKPNVSWNIESDRVVLRTPDGFLVDAFSYTKHWHSEELENSKGVSLEKLDVLFVSDAQSSWTSSGDLKGGTPGRSNNVDVELEASATMRSVPDVFSSDRTHGTNPVAITFSQPFRHAVASIKVFDSGGTPIRTLLNSVFCGSTGAVAWDGVDDSGMRVRPGPYVVVLESVDAASTRVKRSTCVVVVAE